METYFFVRVFDMQTKQKFAGTLNKEQTLDEFYNLSSVKGSFMYIQRESNQQIVQLSYKNERWVLYIPLYYTMDDDNMTTFQKYIEKKQGFEIIHDVFLNQNIYDVYMVDKDRLKLDDIKKSLKELNLYNLNLNNLETIKENYIFSGWERGLFLYWCYVNQLFLDNIYPVFLIYDREEDNHNKYKNISLFTIGDEINLDFFLDEYKDFVALYMIYNYQEFDFYKDIKKLYPDIKNTNEILEEKSEYDKIMKIFDKRYKEYMAIKNL